MLLTGIAINAVAGAGLGLVLFAGDTASREQIVFWQLGSMNGSRWVEVVIVLAHCGSVRGRRHRHGTAAMTCCRWGSVRRCTSAYGSSACGWSRSSCVVLLTAVSVAFTGIIAFVGLVVPHLMRMLLGPSHRMLLIASAIGGGVLLVWADLLARTAVSGAELPIGMLTALVGGPFFFYLIRRARSRVREAGHDIDRAASSTSSEASPADSVTPTYCVGSTWTFDPGEVLALVGPNGAGKSTLLGVISGDLKISGGSAQLRDRDIADWKADELSRAAVGAHPVQRGQLPVHACARWSRWAVARGGDARSQIMTRRHSIPRCEQRRRPTFSTDAFTIPVGR